MAEQEIAQTEASIAERELSLTEARDAPNDARLALIDVLGVDSRTRVLPTDPLRVDPAAHDADRDVEHRVERALRSRPDYLQALLANENAKTALRVADDARKWELNLTASAKAGHRARTLSEAYDRFDDDYFAGLSLNIRWGRAGRAASGPLRGRVSRCGSRGYGSRSCAARCATSRFGSGARSWPARRGCSPNASSRSSGPS